MKKTLLILTGKHKGRTLTLTSDVVVIGRDPLANIRVNSTEVSRKHCEIRVQGDKLIVKDLGSRNGTFIDGDIIFDEAELKPGQTLHIGTMVFELQGRKPASTPSRLPKLPPARASKPASDNDVIDWLVEDRPFSDSDTTLISNADSLENQEVVKPSETSSVTPQPVRIEPIDPGTHAAQAAAIIRNHWQNKKSC